MNTQILKSQLRVDPNHAEAKEKIRQVEPLDLHIKEADKFTQENKIAEALDNWGRIVMVRM